MKPRAVTVCLICFLCFYVWVLTSSVVNVYYDTYWLRGRTVSGIMEAYCGLFDIPITHVVLRGHNGRDTRVEIIDGTDEWLALWPDVTHWSIDARPIVGDHIHMAMSIWTHGKPHVKAEHDRAPIETIEYESKPEICSINGTVAYEKVWPHAGVHTHCDGLIHVHPWSAPRVLRQEGTRVRMGLWFDQVGIRYREHPTSLAFPDGTRFTNNATHQWRVAEYKCFRDARRTVYTEQLDNIWLGHAYASYVMWFDSDAEPPPALQTHIEALEHVGGDGFDGNQYPQQCI